MTLEESADELDKYLDLDLDSKDGASPTDQQKCDVLWKATKDVCFEVDLLLTTVAFTPDALDQQFPLQDDDLSTQPKIGAYMFDVTEVLISSSPINGPLGWLDFKASFPRWRVATDGTPYCFTVTPDQILAFDKPFSVASLLLEDISLSGHGCPRRFDASVDWASEWAVPDLLRWAVVRRACEFASEAYTRHPAALAFIERIGAYAERDLAKFRQLSEGRQSSLESPGFNDPREFLQF